MHRPTTRWIRLVDNADKFQRRVVFDLWELRWEYGQLAYKCGGEVHGHRWKDQAAQSGILRGRNPSGSTTVYKGSDPSFASCCSYKSARAIRSCKTDSTHNLILSSTIRRTSKSQIISEYSV